MVYKNEAAPDAQLTKFLSTCYLSGGRMSPFEGGRWVGAGGRRGIGDQEKIVKQMGLESN